MFCQAVSLAAAVIWLTSVVHALDNGLALTPQMGWDNWNAFGCNVSETLLLQTADLVVKYGLKDLGYHYVILDDCWSAGRSATNDDSLVADHTKFPNGMSSVGDRLHALGLGFGIYSDAGTKTCAGYEGSLDHETVDASTFASWGVDYLKYDNCYNEGQDGTKALSFVRYATMGDAINATGRPMLYSLCNWGEDHPWEWGSSIANSWRISGDIHDSWEGFDVACLCDGSDVHSPEAPPCFRCSITNITNIASSITADGQRGAWNDLDMLEVGNGAMSDSEYVAHFSMWAALKSPLIMGNDLRAISPADLAILSNAAVIAVSQDPLGTSVTRRWNRGVEDTASHSTEQTQLWSGSLMSTTNSSYNDMVMILLNGAANGRTLTATLADVLGDNATADIARLSWEVRDLWADRMSNTDAAAIISAAHGDTPETVGASTRYNVTLGSYAEGLKMGDQRLLGTQIATVRPNETISAMVDPHGVKMFRLRSISISI